MAKEAPENELSPVPTLPVEQMETISTSPLLLAVKRDEYIVVPPAEHDRRLAVRYRDWERLQEDVRGAGKPEQGFLAVLWPLSFGMAATSGFSIMPMATAEHLPAWLVPFYALATVFGVALGCVFFLLDWRYGKTVRGKLQSIAEEMRRIGGVLAEPEAHMKGGPPS